MLLFSAIPVVVCAGSVTQTITTVNPTQPSAGTAIQRMVETAGCSVADGIVADSIPQPPITTTSVGLDLDVLDSAITETNIGTENTLTISDPEMMQQFVTDGLDITALLDELIDRSDAINNNPSSSPTVAVDDKRNDTHWPTPTVNDNFTGGSQRLIDSCVSPQEIRPFPVAERSSGQSTRKRVAMRAQLITSSPFKNELLAKNASKQPSSRKPRERAQPKGVVKSKATAPAKELLKSVRKARSKVVKEGLLNVEVAQSASSSQVPSQEREYLCIYCNDIYIEPPVEPWSQCSICLEWCHESCVPNVKAPFPITFACKNCNPKQRKK